MKKALFIWTLSLLFCGCGGREAAFREWKQYLATTPANAFDTQHASELMNRVWNCEKDQFLPAMWERARGSNQLDAVAACSILVSFVDVPRWSESAQIKSLAAAIDAKMLLNHMNAMEAKTMSLHWQEIHRSNIATLEETLKPSLAGDSLKAAPEE